VPSFGLISPKNMAEMLSYFLFFIAEGKRRLPVFATAVTRG
jgi:hypothetical protein